MLDEKGLKKFKESDTEFPDSVFLENLGDELTKLYSARGDLGVEAQRLMVDITQNESNKDCLQLCELLKAFT